jgi:simple sugar transport system permease protein
VNAVRAGVERLPWRPTTRHVAIVSIALGIVAFWLALPPINVEDPTWPILVGLVAIAGGIWAVTRGVRRAGWGAVAAGLIGVGMGLLAIRASDANLEHVVVWGTLLSATLAWATPLTYAAIGGMLSERSGVVNIGLEGMMLSGCFFGILGADRLDSWELGLLCAAAAGAGFALIHAIVSIHLRADQIVSGFAINFLALGVTGYFFIQIYGPAGSPASHEISRIPNIDENTAVVGPVIDKMHDIPRVGNFLFNVFGHLNLMIWLSFLLLIVAYVVLFRTPIGLRIRSVGEHPRAADTVGISVYATRYAAVVVSGMLAALGGAYLSIGFLSQFTEGMTNGRGYIALAAVILGNWRPFGAFGAALLFGGATALSFRLAGPWESQSVLFQALPYVLTMVAVVGGIRSIPPAAVGRPYVKQ